MRQAADGLYTQLDTPCEMCGATDILSHTCQPPAVRLFNGALVDIRNLNPQDFTPEVIANGLSHIGRYAGNTPYHMSVASHSLLVERILELRSKPPETRLRGLYHDATEIVMGDVPAPLKRWTAWGRMYAADEARVMEAIWAGLGFEPLLEAQERDVAEADHLALVIEAQRMNLHLDEAGEELPALFDREIETMYPYFCGVAPRTAGVARHFVDKHAELVAKL